ncbi:hypothetical protein BT63DRAFT_278408 [Microthyrium microscopicum]|uniref:Uncharacterized protein n=1 Tax=Microthyrium microscopicum TaxID=703497 RepID=A0A6A6UA59_9PEZI|nr:hypothetical protein BT63DRAFT_278408 [Microthyrium microscopicum]
MLLRRILGRNAFRGVTSKNLRHLYRNMATQSTTTASESRSSSNSPPSLASQQAADIKLSLPAPGEGPQSIDVSGDGSTVSLDHLGPVVVNQDGTLSRISNWDAMSEIEKKNTLRILGKRNLLRLKALKEKEGEN